jgi:death-on-curing protein
LPSEPYWLPLAEIVRTNADLVEDTGEPFGIVKPNELESGAARARNLWTYNGERDVLRLAVALMFGIARNHPFVQGNKRTGFVSALMFLRVNGWDLDPAIDSDELGELIVEALRDGAVEAECVEVLRASVFPL